MTITEATRHEMIIALGDAIGKEPAMTLAAHLPPVGWADVATKGDVDHLATVMDHRLAELGSDLRAEIAELGSDLRAEIADVRAEIADVRAEIAGLRGEVGAEIAGLRAEMAQLETRLTDKLIGQTRVLYCSVIATVLTIIGMGLLGG